jgi:hypothetical protein
MQSATGLWFLCASGSRSEGNGFVMKIVSLSVLGLSLAAAWGCASQDPGPASGAQDFKSADSNTANEGESCRGNVLGAKDCAPGLTCVFGDSPVAGTPGTCRAVAGEGESCRGNVLGAKDCAPGLECVFPESNVAGTPGTCVAKSGN